MNLQLILGILFIFAVLLFPLTFAYSSLRAAPWVPTWGVDVQRFLALAQFKSTDTLYDLGCGDGRMVCAAAASGATAVGFDISVLPYLLAQIRRWRLGKNRTRCHIRWRDFWHTDLSKATVIYFFLMPRIFPRLKAQLEQQTKPGTRVITYVWPIDGWTPVMVSTSPNQPKMYLYIR